MNRKRKQHGSGNPTGAKLDKLRAELVQTLKQGRIVHSPEDCERLYAIRDLRSALGHLRRVQQLHVAGCGDGCGECHDLAGVRWNLELGTEIIANDVIGGCTDLHDFDACDDDE